MLTPMRTHTTSNPSRRRFLGGFATVLALSTSLSSIATSALALSTREASDLVGRLVKDINRAINSGKTGSALYRDFEKIFAKYADVPIIAQSVLGVEWRSASQAQRRAFTQAFQGYLARKYGRRFREFEGGQIEVKSARKVKSFFEVKSTALLRGESPFEVIFLVSDRSGQDKFFNIIIEGVNLRVAERTEIGSMLDKRGGNIDALISDLTRAG